MADERFSKSFSSSVVGKDAEHFLSKSETDMYVSSIALIIIILKERLLYSNLSKSYI